MGVETTSWQPDPFGVHEFRFFSADGKPTLLVMDGGNTSYDPPPAQRTPPTPEPPASAEREPPPVLESPERLEPEPPPVPDPILTLAPSDAPSAARNEVAVSSHPQTAVSEDKAETQGVTRVAAPVVGRLFRD